MSRCIACNRMMYKEDLRLDWDLCRKCISESDPIVQERIYARKLKSSKKGDKSDEQNKMS